MDTKDLEILDALVTDGRTTFSDLAARVGLSGPSTAERVRRLEADGVIAGYAATLDPATVGAELAAFLTVTLATPDARGPFLRAMAAEPSVLEVHHVAGDGDYLVKVRCGSTRDLERIVTEVVKGVVGVAATRTTVVLSSVFERPVGVMGR